MWLNASVNTEFRRQRFGPAVGRRYVRSLGVTSRRNKRPVKYLHSDSTHTSQMLTAGPTERESKVVAEHFEDPQGLVVEDIYSWQAARSPHDDRTFGIVVLVLSVSNRKKGRRNLEK